MHEKHLAWSLADGEYSKLVSSFCYYHITVGKKPDSSKQGYALEHMAAILNLDQGGRPSQEKLSETEEWPKMSLKD